MTAIGTLSRLALALALGGCASLTVADTKPLPPARFASTDSFSISQGGYRLQALPPHPEAPDLLVMVAMSGGGKRSSSFGYGALKGMREVSVPTAAGPVSLLSQLSAVAGVSGGSFPAAYYGLHRDAAFGAFERDFLYRDTEANIYGVYLLPWNWSWLVDPTIGTNDYMDHVYDETMFHGATYADLQAKGRPLVAVGATDLSYGTPFLFTQESFDLICSDLDKFPVSRAVAASNGLPGLFSPVTLTSRAADCGGRRPGWRERITPAQMADPLSRTREQATFADRYLDPKQTEYVHLIDGGASDNLSMRAAGGLLLAGVADIDRTFLPTFRRILLLSIDGQGGEDSSAARSKAVGGLFSLLGLVANSQIDRYNFETLLAMNEQLEGLRAAIVKARCARGPTFAGARCDDVQTKLIHLSLSGAPDSPERTRLLAIPTGLTIARADVDALVRAGHDAVTGSEALRAFLANYPAADAPPS